MTLRSKVRASTYVEERRPLPPVASCANCGKHNDRDLPLADKCLCSLK